MKLYDIAHYIFVKGRAFNNFEDLIELEKLQGVKFQSGSYENRMDVKILSKVLLNISLSKIYAVN